MIASFVMWLVAEESLTLPVGKEVLAVMSTNGELCGDGTTRWGIRLCTPAEVAEIEGKPLPGRCV